MRVPRRTVRLRLTLLYGGLFLISGAGLLGVTYFLVQHAVAASFPPALDLSHDLYPEIDPEAPGSMLQALSIVTREAVARQNVEVMRQLLTSSGVALALMSAISIVLGWIVAGRILRRLRTIAATTRDISATNLHRRLALDGPADELKELGDTIDGLLCRLEDAFQSQRQFVGNASHELRTPLNRQRVLGQVALSDPEATVASLRAAHERILIAGAQQERLIEALLTLSRGQAGIEVLNPFDVAALTHEILDSRRAEAASRGLEIRSSIAAATAAGHRPLAERLVANLVDNALRHNTADGWVEVSTESAAGRAVLTVANSGPVVPPDVVERLYQPFQRLGAARTGEGLGLGLSIVQAVALAHGAAVTTVARPQGGLVITITFPR
ncbi:sensor histidine kinase [Nonomuraea endophytica]|uniref:sensor histidine kinase n=1 Tax=Nonomuraea endophytica TaxID=714136 RepID=UPI0037C75682